MLWILYGIGILGAGVMIFLLVVGIFAVTIDKDMTWKDIRVKTLIKNFLICGAIAVAADLVYTGIGYMSYDEVVQTNEWEMVSLTDNSQISGEGAGGLFYVHMSIEEEEVYSFYYKVDNGGFKKGKVEAENTIIYEEDDATPRVVEYTTYTKNKMEKPLLLILTFGYGESTHKNYEIYTPTGTILRSFSLDLQ